MQYKTIVMQTTIFDNKQVQLIIESYYLKSKFILTLPRIMQIFL